MYSYIHENIEIYQKINKNKNIKYTFIDVLIITLI